MPAGDYWIVYFIREGNGPVKIGTMIVSSHPDSVRRRIKRRLGALQVGNPRRLQSIGVAIGVSERDVHRMFHEERILGEWFEPSDRLMKYIREVSLEATH